MKSLISPVLGILLFAGCSSTPATIDKELPDKALLSKSIQDSVSRGDWKSAIDHCNDYLNYYPSTEDADAIKQILYESCKNYLIEGEKRAFLFIPYTTRKVPIEKFTNTLRSYPYESYTAEYIYWFAEFLRERNDMETAELQYQKILDRYKDSNFADLALFRLGEINIARFKGIEYSADMLKDAELYFSRIIEEYPGSGLIDKARENVRRIQNYLADKIFEAGLFYERKGNLKGAAMYFQEIITKYPETTAASKCRDKLHSKNE